jgi:stalled ribosome rescue protein Dom34
MHKHLIVWLDHKEARILHLRGGAIEEARLAAPLHIHHKPPVGPPSAKEHPDDAERFFHEIARTIEGAAEILLVGPSTAKLEFIRYAHRHRHAIESKIVGVETVAVPTDGQLVAFAKMYFEDEARAS